MSSFLNLKFYETTIFQFLTNSIFNAIIFSRKEVKNMSPQLSEIRQHFGPGLVGRIINLQDVSDDAYEIVARIVEVKLEGDNLIIKTEGTHRRWWSETKFETFDRNEFSHSLEFLEEVKIEANGTIILIPWGGYDYVYIRP